MWTRLRATVSRLPFVWRRRNLDEEAWREINDHVDLLTARYVRQGMTQEEAYSAARRQFGNVTIVREDIHESNSIGWIEQAARDLRYGFRQLRASPGFTLVVAAALGLGIGGTTAVFSVVEAVLLKPLPYEQPGELVRFYQQRPGRPDTQGVLAGTHFTFLREHATAFEDVAALAHYSETGLDLATADGRVERLRVLRVSSDYFSTLHSDPAVGRGFDRDDETGTRRVVLSDRVWRTFFNADASIVGATIRLSAEPYEVAGVARAGFEDPVAPDVAAWIPYPLARDTYEENNSLTALGRLRNGVSLEQAQAELATLEPLMRERWPAAQLSALVALPLHEELVENARGPLQLVFAAVGLLLLLACDNRNWALIQVVAARQVPEHVLEAVRAEVTRLDPELVVHRPAAMTEVVGRGAGRERFAVVIMGAFALVSLLLAALGLYGVLAYMVRERTAEIGIRIALGATSAHVRALVLRQAAVVVGIGVAAGVGGALLLGRWLGALAFETSPSDPRILLSTALLLAVVAFVAAWLPAQRAARVAPTMPCRKRTDCTHF